MKQPNPIPGSASKSKNTTPLKDFFAPSSELDDRFVNNRRGNIRRNLGFDSETESPLSQQRALNQGLKRRSRSFNDIHKLIPPSINSPGLSMKSPSCMNLRRNIPKLKKPDLRKPFR
jgi:hypothetical protein